jgi:hypothetical protein
MQKRARYYRPSGEFRHSNNAEPNTYAADLRGCVGSGNIDCRLRISSRGGVPCRISERSFSTACWVVDSGWPHHVLQPDYKRALDICELTLSRKSSVINPARHVHWSASEAFSGSGTSSARRCRTLKRGLQHRHRQSADLRQRPTKLAVDPAANVPKPLEGQGRIAVHANCPSSQVSDSRLFQFFLCDRSVYSFSSSPDGDHVSVPVLVVNGSLIRKTTIDGQRDTAASAWRASSSTR